jgi:SAM-dependent methyltransferase
MIGKATASLEPVPRRWLQRWFGLPDIHYRQKRRAIWPQLRSLPAGPTRLLDAGCGNGNWTLELARRRPDWQLLGLDCSTQAIFEARRRAERLGIRNVSFMVGDFLEYEPHSPFDVVLSVASAHYAVQAGDGVDLFRAFRHWLSPSGTLVLLGPRVADEVPAVPILPSLAQPRIFSSRQLRSLCAAAGLQVDLLQPCVGASGTAAKQLALSARHSPILQGIVYPIQFLLDQIERIPFAPPATRSCFWLLRASSGPAALPQPLDLPL